MHIIRDKTFDEINIGDMAFMEKTLTEKDMRLFANGVYDTALFSILTTTKNQ